MTKKIIILNFRQNNGHFIGIFVLEEMYRVSKTDIADTVSNKDGNDDH